MPDLVGQTAGHYGARADTAAERCTHKLRAYAETPSANRHLRYAEIGRFLCLEKPCRNQSFSAWNNGLSLSLKTGADGLHQITRGGIGHLPIHF